ncbi:uncharacterized protein FTJAE_5027 [Fusarium tjaetaba]|uniref:Uncharacterized protein n=1 Tax=Fusarium tjaetaba TaxID=1567544 RepID=A0A8H5VXB6_9HYPO|nr:uncharacterized protein FTJAE_5027 [Fusarium tjaetaba]KAF5638956.1 hypothetical protein FTJAE_5027 [Fusarium tjaetaba]
MDDTHPATAEELPQRLLEFKRKCTHGDPSPLTKFHPSKADYTRLHDKLEVTFRRFDYNPRRQVISFHMPSTTHYFFVSMFRMAIWDEIREISCQDQRARVFTKSIANAGFTRLSLVDGSDNQMRNAKEFRRLAKRYIHHTDGQIKVVLGIDLNEDKESTISVWKPTFTPLQNGDGVEMDIEQVFQSEPFRDANKNPVDGTLTLRLHDFAPDHLCQDCPNTPFSISYRDMSDMVASAEEHKRGLEREETPAFPGRVVHKRRLSDSSGDRIKAKKR